MMHSDIVVGRDGDNLVEGSLIAQAEHVSFVISHGSIRVLHNRVVYVGSHFNTLQERYRDDPWAVFLICKLLNQSNRASVDRVLREVMSIAGTAQDVMMTTVGDIAGVLAPTGLAQRKASSIHRMAEDYLLKDWKQDPTVIHGVGQYARDAYEVFCQRRILSHPSDKAVSVYNEWRRRKLHEHRKNTTEELNEFILQGLRAIPTGRVHNFHKTIKTV